jgi:hypothetical protein
MVVPMTRLALAGLMALGALNLSGCVYEPYPSYAGYPGYYPGYYPAPAYGSVDVGVGFGGGWHDGWRHDGWHHWR